MSITFVVGGLGDGKSLYCMSRLVEYLGKGKKIATNYNLNLEALCRKDNKHSRVIRLPDSPSKDDFRAIGLGSDKPGDKNNGLLLLDELGTWFNARDFASKGRQEVLKYCIHLRKKRWDVFFIVQDFSMVDKQLRGGMTTYLTVCRSSHRANVLLKLFPKFHFAVVRNKDKLKVRTDFIWPFEARSLYPVYDTEQLFNVEEDADADDVFGDVELQKKEAMYAAQNGLYCYLPPGYTLPAKIDVPKAPGAAGALQWVPGKRLAYSFGGIVSALCVGMAFSGGDAVVADDVVPIETGVDPQSISADPDTSPVEPAGVDAFLARFSGYRIQSFTRFGSRHNYVFVDADGQRVPQSSLLDEGFRVIGQGRESVTIMNPGRQFITVRNM